MGNIFCSRGIFCSCGIFCSPGIFCSCGIFCSRDIFCGRGIFPVFPMGPGRDPGPPLGRARARAPPYSPIPPWCSCAGLPSGSPYISLFLRHILYLLMRMVFYVNHGGLQADLKGGSGGAAAPPGNKSLNFVLAVQVLPGLCFGICICVLGAFQSAHIIPAQPK